MVSADRNANSRALKGRIALRPAAAARCSLNGSHSRRLPAVLSVCGLRPCSGALRTVARLKKRRGMALLPSDVLAKGGSCSWETVEAGAGLCPIGLAALRGEAWGIAGRCPTVVSRVPCFRWCLRLSVLINSGSGRHHQRDGVTGSGGFLD